MVVFKPGGPWMVCLECKHMFSLSLLAKVAKLLGKSTSCPKCGSDNFVYVRH